MLKVGLSGFQALLLLLASLDAHSNDRKPNIVLILADDLGYNEIGSYGQKLIKTPNLDSLAKEGVRFLQHYSGSPLCAPSRSVLLSGMHTGHNSIRGNLSAGWGDQPIPAEENTIAEVLASNGYVTGAFGKWGLGTPNSSGDPLLQGFEEFFGYYSQENAHSYYPEYLWSNGEKVRLNNNPPIQGHARFPEGVDTELLESYSRFKGNDYAPDRINHAALNFIRENSNRPFFLYYPTILPHLALHIPDEHLVPYLALGWDDPPFTYQGKRGYTPHFTPKAAYAAMITRMDYYVGQILSQLEKEGLADNTIVIFTSDNGTSSMAEEVNAEFFNSTGVLRGKKGSLYEGGVRVPAIVRWPNRVKADTTSNSVSGFEDWFATIVNATGSKNEAINPVDGVDLISISRGVADKPRPPLYRELPDYGAQQSVRAGDWKAIRTQLGIGSMHTELYNLVSDPMESQDVSALNPEVVAELEQVMLREHSESEVFPLPSIDTLARKEAFVHQLKGVYRKIRSVLTDAKPRD